MKDVGGVRGIRKQTASFDVPEMRGADSLVALLGWVGVSGACGSHGACWTGLEANPPVELRSLRRLPCMEDPQETTPITLHCSSSTRRKHRKKGGEGDPDPFGTSFIHPDVPRFCLFSDFFSYSARRNSVRIGILYAAIDIALLF